MDTFGPLVAILLGFVLLLAGKRVIWLAAALAAYLFISPILARYIDPGTTGMVVSVVVGLVLAWLAVRFFQSTVAVVAALVGAATMPSVLGMLGIEWAWWIMALIGAAAGLLLAGVALDWGLMLVTAWLGANLLARSAAELLGISGPVLTVVSIVLLLIGVFVQANGKSS